MLRKTIDAWNNFPALTSLGSFVNLINCRFHPAISNNVITESQIGSFALQITNNETSAMARE
jgi:hypothetical protein